MADAEFTPPSLARGATLRTMADAEITPPSLARRAISSRSWPALRRVIGTRADAEIKKLGADDEERLRACFTGIEIHGDALKARLAHKLLGLEEQQSRSWHAEHCMPPSLARTTSFFSSSSRSLVTSGLRKGLKKGPQTAVPVDVVLDTFEVLCGARGGKGEAGECACMCCTVFCSNTVGQCGCT